MSQVVPSEDRNRSPITRRSKIKIGVFSVFILTIVSLCIMTITVGIDTSNVYDEITDAFLCVLIVGILAKTGYALHKLTRETDKPATTLNYIILLCSVLLCVILILLNVLNKFSLFRKQPPGPAPMPPGPAPMPPGPAPMSPGPAPMPMPPGSAPFPTS